MTDTNFSGARETAKQIMGAGGVAVAVETDVSVPESVQKLVEKVLQSFGKVDTLLNNAAIQVSKTVEETTFEEWNRQMGINLG
mgnify:CR=1 FL=1